MTDSQPSNDAHLDREAAELRRVLQADLLPGILANPNLSSDQFMALWTSAATKAGLIPAHDADTSSGIPTSEDISHWGTEIRSFFDELKREFPNTYRDQAFVAAAKARVPELVRRILKPPL